MRPTIPMGAEIAVGVSVCFTPDERTPRRNGHAPEWCVCSRPHVRRRRLGRSAAICSLLRAWAHKMADPSLDRLNSLREEISRRVGRLTGLVSLFFPGTRSTHPGCVTHYQPPRDRCGFLPKHTLRYPQVPPGGRFSLELVRSRTESAASGATSRRWR